MPHLLLQLPPWDKENPLHPSRLPSRPHDDSSHHPNGIFPKLIWHFSPRKYHFHTRSKWSFSMIYILLNFSEHNPPQHPSGHLIVFFSSSKYLSFFSEAITHTMLNVIGPLPLWLALLWSNVLHWTMYFRCLCLCICLCLFCCHCLCDCHQFVIVINFTIWVAAEAWVQWWQRKKLPTVRLQPF